MNDVYLILRPMSLPVAFATYDGACAVAQSDWPGCTFRVGRMQNTLIVGTQIVSRGEVVGWICATQLGD